MCGGLVTILLVIGIFTQACYTFVNDYSSPQFNQYPSLFDFNNRQNINVDFKTNMVAYSVDQGEDIFSYVRFIFKDVEGGDVIPAVLCSEYFADEIAAEADGTSDSTFYTDTYADLFNLTWICPNLTETKIIPYVPANFVMYFVSCQQA